MHTNIYIYIYIYISTQTYINMYTYIYAREKMIWKYKKFSFRKTCQRRWTIVRSSERELGISVLAARHDDGIYTYIYIYIYIYIHFVYLFSIPISLPSVHFLVLHWILLVSHSTVPHTIIMRFTTRWVRQPNVRGDVVAEIFWQLILDFPACVAWRRVLYLDVGSSSSQ